MSAGEMPLSSNSFVNPCLHDHPSDRTFENVALNELVLLWAFGQALLELVDHILIQGWAASVFGSY